MVSHGHKQVVGVQHFVVFQVVQQRIGDGARLSGQENGRTFHANRGADKHGLQKAG